MLCVECGHINQPYNKSCEKCGVLLPDRKNPPPPLMANYNKLEEFAEKVKNREISSGEFRDFLNNMEAQFRSLLEEVQKIEIPEDAREEMKQEIVTGIGGIKLYLEAFKEMHQFLDTREAIFIERGLAMAKDANNRLNEAMRMNWESFKNIQETAEEFIRTQSGI